jgi:hypothetical protein
MEPVKLLERAATGTAHAVRHPISSAAYAFGIVRGLAGAVVSGATVTGHDPKAGPALRANGTPGQHLGVVPDVPHREAAPQREPAPPGESFATEPKATSRSSEHGGRGDDAEIDQWAAESADQPDIDIETPVGTTGADVGYNPDTAEADLQQPGTEPLLDPATAKAIRSEAAMMQKAAEPDLE